MKGSRVPGKVGSPVSRAGLLLGVLASAAAHVALFWPGAWPEGAWPVELERPRERVRLEEAPVVVAPPPSPPASPVTPPERQPEREPERQAPRLEDPPAPSPARPRESDEASSASATADASGAERAGTDPDHAESTASGPRSGEPASVTVHIDWGDHAEAMRVLRRSGMRIVVVERGRVTQSIERTADGWRATPFQTPAGEAVHVRVVEHVAAFEPVRAALPALGGQLAVWTPPWVDRQLREAAESSAARGSEGERVRVGGRFVVESRRVRFRVEAVQVEPVDRGGERESVSMGADRR